VDSLVRNCTATCQGSSERFAAQADIDPWQHWIELSCVWCLAESKERKKKKQGKKEWERYLKRRNEMKKEIGKVDSLNFRLSKLEDIHQ
jgi:hypothetical protein